MFTSFVVRLSVCPAKPSMTVMLIGIGLLNEISIVHTRALDSVTPW